MSSHDSFDDLEARLLDLGASLDVPAPPPADVAAAVRARLAAGAIPKNAPETRAPEPAPERRAPETASEPAPETRTPETASEPAPETRAPERARKQRPARERPPARPGVRRRRWTVVVAVVLAVVAVTAATPQGRAAVAAILRYAGIELRLGGTPAPVITPTTLPGERDVEPSRLGSQVAFPVRTPAALGPPAAATVGDNGRVASMFWPDGIRLDQFDGTMEPFFFKRLGPPHPQDVPLGTTTAWWIGGSHPLGYIEREDGTSVPLRQAAPTLIWQSGAVGYRLEGAGTKERAAEIAASLR